MFGTKLGDPKLSGHITLAAWAGALAIVGVAAVATSPAFAATAPSPALAALSPPATPAQVSSCGACDKLQKDYVIRTGQPDVKVRPAEALGLFEVSFADQNFFTDANGRYAIAGHLIDTVNRVDLTNMRQSRANAKKLSSQLKDIAIYRGKADAKYQLIIFTDPDCRRLEEMLVGMDDVRTATILFPLTQLHPQAKNHARAIWCAKDRDEAFKAVMLRGENLQPTADCSAEAVDKGLALGEGMGIRGTPNLYRTDGAKWGGLPPSADALRKWLQDGLRTQPVAATAPQAAAPQAAASQATAPQAAAPAPAM